MELLPISFLQTGQENLLSFVIFQAFSLVIIISTLLILSQHSGLVMHYVSIEKLLEYLTFLNQAFREKQSVLFSLADIT